MRKQLPTTLMYFVTDTGDAPHGYSGAIEDEHQEARIREHYPKVDSVQGMEIGHYALVKIERIPVDGS